MGIHPSDTNLVKEVREYFVVGNLRSRPNIYVFSVVKLNDILTHIIPHFEKSPVKSVKWNNLLNWVEVSNIMEQKGHLTDQ